ncbi:RNA polymerase sigma factor [Dactylosporangium sp. CA-092794]|uniref:RNA polymerase sigma factor n=1 Tax=Dactylosporangium sp. CA-092794 TaxID=3239929 RepID=UPI003D8EB718
MSSSDRDLAVLAQSGDMAALGSLFALHRAGMLRVALSVLRRPDDAEDVVQDAALTALGRIGELRDPAAVGPWLRVIVRNACRMRLRGPSATLAESLPRTLAASADPQQVLDRHAMRDGVWYAIGRLAPHLRTVTMLRYFSAVTRYDEIAALCGIPVGTVRSRLNEARRQLAGHLLAVRHSAYDGTAAIIETRRREAEQAVAAGHAGTFAELLRDGWRRDVDATWADGRRLRGIEAIARHMDGSMAVGIKQRLAGVVASEGVTIWEMDVLNPLGAERPCPSYTVWLLSYDAGRIDRLRLYSRPV